MATLPRVGGAEAKALNRKAALAKDRVEGLEKGARGRELLARKGGESKADLMQLLMNSEPSKWHNTILNWMGKSSLVKRSE